MTLWSFSRHLRVIRGGFVWRFAMKSVGQYFLGVMLVGLFPGCVHYQNRPLSAEQTHANFENRSLNDPELRAFLDRSSQPDAFTWPLKSWDFPATTLAALFFHPALDVARA